MPTDIPDILQVRKGPRMGTLEKSESPDLGTGSFKQTVFII